MNKHTPGPWIVIKEKYYAGEACITSQDRIYNSKGPICELDYIFDGPHGDEQIANMALISAAPDLLEALEEILDGYLYGCDMKTKRENIKKANAAIARARGEA